MLLVTAAAATFSEPVTFLTIWAMRSACSELSTMSRRPGPNSTTLGAACMFSPLASRTCAIES